MRIASLDLGSNTFLLLIADVNIDGDIHVLEDVVEVTRLAQEVDKTGKFHKEALDRAEECFKNFKSIIKKYDVDKVVASATSAARDAKNKEEFFSLGQKYGIPIHVIEGQKEAELTFRGSTYDVQNESVAVIDVGGGSTEIIGKNNGEVLGRSIDIGSVRLTEKFITSHPVLVSELKEMEGFIRHKLTENKKFLPVNGIKKIIAVAGTPTLLACLIQEIEYDESKVHQFLIKIDLLKEWQMKLAKMTVKERQALKGMQPKRADVIVAGLTILLEALSFLNLNEIIVSTKGVRYGLALEAAQGSNHSNFDKY